MGGHSLTEGLVRSEVDIVADIVDTLCDMYSRLLGLVMDCACIEFAQVQRSSEAIFPLNAIYTNKESFQHTTGLESSEHTALAAASLYSSISKAHSFAFERKLLC